MDQQVLTQAQTRWVKLGLFQSISPTIQYTPGKANVLADALSKSRHGPIEAESPSTEEPLVALAVAAVVPDEEVKLWKQALEEDPKYGETVRQLRNQQSCGEI